MNDKVYALLVRCREYLVGHNKRLALDNIVSVLDGMDRDSVVAGIEMVQGGIYRDRVVEYGDGYGIASLLGTYGKEPGRYRLVLVVDGIEVDIYNLAERFNLAMAAEVAEQAKGLVSSRVEKALTSLTEAIHEAEDKLMTAFGEPEEVAVPENELGPDGCPAEVWTELLSYGMTPLAARKAWVLCSKALTVYPKE